MSSDVVGTGPGAGMEPVPTTDEETLGRGIARFFADLWFVVFYQPVRYGTLYVRWHSRGVAGITWAVAILYALIVGSIIIANPLRSAAEFETLVDATSSKAVPTFLIPAALCLLGVAFGVLLAGSQRSPWWRRLLFLGAIVGILVSVTAIAFANGVGGILAWTCVVLLGLMLAYVVVMWVAPTRPAPDTLILVVLCDGILLASYRSVVNQTLLNNISGTLLVTSLVLGFLGALAIPMAFLAGVSATSLGVSFVAWTGDAVGERAAAWFSLLLACVVLAWQWVSAGREWSEAFSPTRLSGLLGALIVAVLCAALWLACHRGERWPEGRPTAVAAAAAAVAVPVCFGLAAIPILGSILGMLAVTLGTLVSPALLVPFNALLDVLSTDNAVTLNRAAVVIGLVIGGALLMRRSRRLFAAIAMVDAVVVAGTFFLPMLPGGWFLSAPRLGDVGMATATILLAFWAARRELPPHRVAFLLVLILLSALVRQADFFALPLGFLIGASTAALLIFGLIWGFLTDGGAVHDDARSFPRDRQMLVLLGYYLFSIVIVAWSVIGKDVDIARVLSDDTALSVRILGSAMILSVVLACGLALQRTGGVRSQTAEDAEEEQAAEDAAAEHAEAAEDAAAEHAEAAEDAAAEHAEAAEDAAAEHAEAEVEAEATLHSEAAQDAPESAPETAPREET
ncbi:MAG: hypothetical protein ACKOT0_06015 [bacterium]